jgi:hypothetical protein
MSKQLLHLVFGGELTDLKAHEFRDVNKLHFVGIYPNYKEAQSAWRGAAQASVDNAMMRYFVVHLHRLMEPGEHAHDTVRQLKPLKVPPPSKTKTVRKAAIPPAIKKKAASGAKNRASIKRRS